MKRFAPLLGAAAVLGLILTGAGAAAASASTAAPAPVVHGLNNQFYSQSLAGFGLDGNGSATFAGEWKQIEVNPQATCPVTNTTGSGAAERWTCFTGSPGVAPDAFAVGIALEQNLSVGGPIAGEALVLSDARTATLNGNLPCGLGQWTLEAGAGAIMLSPGGFPVDTRDLAPLHFFGADVCFSAAAPASEFTYVYHSSKHFETDFSAGPTSNNWNVLETLHGIPWGARTAAEGMTTTTGANAAQVATGNVNTTATGTAVFESGHGNSNFGQGRNFYSLGYDVWEGTLDGMNIPPSLSDPLTLSVNPASLVGPYGPSSISAP